MVAIARVLDISSKILILDEPTSSLDESEVEQLFKVIRSLRDEGLGHPVHHALPRPDLPDLGPHHDAEERGVRRGVQDRDPPEAGPDRQDARQGAVGVQLRTESDQKKRASTGAGADTKNVLTVEGSRSARLHRPVRPQPQRGRGSRAGRAPGLGQDGDGPAHLRHRRGQPG